jgi:hypothetical protein
MADEIVNKVAASGLITLDLEAFLPDGPFVSFDLKDHLFMGLILKEKDFREALKATDWQAYAGKYVSIVCTADAIIPLWAYMLVTSYVQPIAKGVYAGTESEFYKQLVLKNLASLDVSKYTDQRLVIKGCGDKSIEAYAYTEITRLLLPHVKSIMYGEPCSTVPVYKKK